MEIIPAVDIKGGRCVRLYQGDFQQETIFSSSPLEFALRWQKLGASRLHVVDLDAAARGEPINWHVVQPIVSGLKIPIELGGGMRRLETIKKALDMGVQRVILGTAAIEDEGLVASACSKYGPAVIIGIDARDGIVSTKGWTARSRITPEELIHKMVPLGAQRFICTDIKTDGTLEGPNLKALASLKKVTSLPIIASGGVSSLEHLEKLAAMGMEGAIVGKAFYTGDLDPKEVLARKW